MVALPHGTFLTSDWLHFSIKAGGWAQASFRLLHVKTTSYKQQINERQLHPASSLPPFPCTIRSSPSLIYKEMNYPMNWSCPKHSLRPWHIMDALICSGMKEFSLWIYLFWVHRLWNLSDYPWIKDFFFLISSASYWHKWLRKVLCRRIITVCSHCDQSINPSVNLSLCLGHYLNLQLQNGVQIHMKPLLVSEKGQYQTPFNLWGFFTPVGAQTCPFTTPLELGETGESRTGRLHPYQRMWVMKSTRNSMDSTFLISRAEPVSTVKSSPPQAEIPSGMQAVVLTQKSMGVHLPVQC